MRLLALLLAAAALPLVLVVGLLAGLAIGLASWVLDEAPQPPEHLVPIYQEAAQATGVPWVAIAAIDGAANGFELPVPSAMKIFRKLYEAEAERLLREWRDRCGERGGAPAGPGADAATPPAPAPAANKATAAPATASAAPSAAPVTETPASPPAPPPPPPGCGDPPTVPDDTVWRLWQEARARHQAALLSHIRANAQRLQARMHTLDRSPESAYDGLVPAGRDTLATDLYLGYTLLTE